MPGAGQLRHRIRFDRRTTSADGAGNFTSDWAPLVAVAADIRPMGGTEAIAAGRLQGEQGVEITIRWDDRLGDGGDKITTNDQAVNARTGTVYNIRSIADPDMRRQWLRLTCEAGVAT